MPIDFSTYQTSVASQNASLNEGHKFVNIFGLGGFQATLWALHPTQGVLKRIPEFLITEDPAIRRASPSTLKGLAQLVDEETKQGELDSKLGQSVAGAGRDLSLSLTSEGLPQGFPVFLHIEVRKNSDDTPESYNVGQLRTESARYLSNGDVQGALRYIFGNAVTTFAPHYQGMTLDGVVEDVVFKVPGVKEAVMQAVLHQ